MKTGSDWRLPVLVVADDPRRLARYEADLWACGFEPMTFSSCYDALLWLEEETPDFAILSLGDDQAQAVLTEMLGGRGIAIAAVDQVESSPGPMARFAAE